MNKAKNDLSTRVTMLCKDFNIKQSDSSSWPTYNDLNSEERFNVNSVKNSYAIGAVNLSNTTYLIAALLLLIKDEKKYIIPHFFMPSDVLKKRMEEDSVLFGWTMIHGTPSIGSKKWKR
jgi:phage terminase large subunit-like protein